MWLSIRLALRPQRLREILRLRLTLGLRLRRQSFCVSRLLGVSVLHRAPVVILRVHGALLARVRAHALIVLWVRSSIIAIHGLSHWRRALHHVGSLG